MTATTIIENLKDSKLGKGAKISAVSNCVTVQYPIHKLRVFWEERASIKKLLGFEASGGLSIVKSCQVGNKGCVQIWIM